MKLVKSTIARVDLQIFKIMTILIGFWETKTLTKIQLNFGDEITVIAHDSKFTVVYFTLEQGEVIG